MSTTSLCCAAGAALTAAARLPGRREAAGSAAGFRGVVGFTLLSLASPPKPKVTRLACAMEPWPTEERQWLPVNPEDEYHGNEVRKPTYYGDEEEFVEFYADLSKHAEDIMSGRQFIFIPPELSEEERAVQNKLKEIAERCMDLLVDAMRRLRPEQRRPLYLPFRTVHFAFVSVKVRAIEGIANLGVSSLLIVDKLDTVRKMVSSACSAPLPLDTDKMQQLSSLLEEAIGGLGDVDSNSSPQVVPFAMIDYTYKTVKSDIDKMMITASGSATSTS